MDPIGMDLTGMDSTSPATSPIDQLELMNRLCQRLELQTPRIKTLSQVQHRAAFDDTAPGAAAPEWMDQLPTPVRKELARKVALRRTFSCRTFSSPTAAKNDLARDVNVALDHLWREEQKKQEVKKKRGAGKAVR
ncbi:unnamed protein product [Zymoseptoria tritici ST99CH_1E4]|uniref:Uncharacterized protein n=1 Tax=Zymoseptoria tritici ST99CH_1E4 TaxID=1276532 RepID=A0A2H1H9X5_ZYMTR|nr:unnamed protein product [Zymoseptoria tritici ST99CH_1E4]